jgi:hypothetical protein
MILNKRTYRQNCNGTETKSIDCSNKMTDRKSWKNREKKDIIIHEKQ